MVFRTAALTLAALLGATSLPAQDKPATSVDPARVDNAIRKGIAWLKTAGSPIGPVDGKSLTSDELILWTFVHARVPENDARFRELLKKILEAPLEGTYTVSLQAMVLEEIDRVKYQTRIAHCAQFLVDNQCRNGQWSYGQPTTLPNDIPSVGTPSTATARKGALDFSQEKEKVKPKVVRKLTVKKQRDGLESGDNSNTQYAVLGLRACNEAGIVVPAEVIQKAIDWWRSTIVMEKNGGAPAAVATGPGDPGVEPGFWRYRPDHPNRIYGMTAGGVGSLCILNKIQGTNWKADKAARAGISWLGAHFNAAQSDEEKFRHYYYLYALERAAILYGTETLGKHVWYAEGANWLLDGQKPDGSWDVGDRTWAPWNPVWDTCFAILFLKRATRPLVASEDTRKER
jgi:hypothetical protein